MKKIIQYDQQLLIYLNNLGNPNYDTLWLFITKQLHWVPVFIITFYFLQKKIGWKNLGVVLVFITLLITCTDQFTNYIKHTIQRPRPCNEIAIAHLIRIVKSSASYSFFSGHATNSMAATVFVYLILKKYYRYAGVLFVFPLVFAYSRIYLGLHYPIDIVTGYAVGIIFGFIFQKLYTTFYQKYPQLVS